MTKDFFRPTGRINRKTYILRLLAILVPGLLLRAATGHILDPFMLLLANWGIIFLMYCQAVQMVKRLHDLGRSGFYFLLVLVPFVNLFLGFYLLLAKGTVGDNEYGLDPNESLAAYPVQS